MKIYGLVTTTLVFSNEDLNDIIKIVKSLEESGLLKKGVSKTAENEAKKTRRRTFIYVHYVHLADVVM